MASIHAVMGEYRIAKSDKDTFADKYFCSLCNNVLRDPLQTNCGHFYCKPCYNSGQDPDGSFVCLQDEVFLTATEVYPDTFMKREVLSLRMKCPADGCRWSGEIRDLESHLSKCPESRVHCSNAGCTVEIKRAKLLSHLDKECMFSPRSCSYCNEMIVANDMESHHSQSCKTYPVRCPGCGKDKIKREELERHRDAVEGDCEATQMNCAFDVLGCSADKSMKREDAKKHEEICGVFHLSMLLVFALDLEQKVQSALSGPRSGEFSAIAHFRPDCKSKLTEAIAKIDWVFDEIKVVKENLSEHSMRIATLETQILGRTNNSVGASAAAMSPTDKNGILPDERLRRLINLENRTADHEVLICEGGRNQDDIFQKVQSLQQQLKAAQGTIRRLEERVESHEHSLTQRNVALADLEEFIRHQEVSSYDGVLLWKISDFARRKNEAVTGRQASFYSACFYTSRHGYKMCARIYLNGDGMGKDTHVSVFFVVMRGQFDALLRWPFRQKVTMMLLDQDNVEHVIDAFRPDPNSASFLKPRREMNVASGCPLFCALSLLNKHAYVRDDTMFIKIVVDTSDV